jgi:hypothetical protein
MILFWILIWCALGYAGGWIAARKGYSPRLGVIVAVLFGPIALIVCALLPMTEAGREQAEMEREISQDNIYHNRLKKCPNCGRDIAFTCRVCPRCEHRFVPAAME